MVLDGQFSQDVPVCSSRLHSRSYFYLIHITDLPDVILNTTTYADETSLYSKCDQACDLWQQLELAYELKTYLQDTGDWGRK